MFCLFDELDKPFKGMGVLATDDGVVVFAMDDSNKSNLKTAVIYSPIEQNTKHIECCLVCCEKYLISLLPNTGFQYRQLQISVIYN